MAFPPETLLFGATSAVLHYNCFRRLLSVLVDRIFGIPIVGYFDEFGAPSPEEMDDLALETFEHFCDAISIRLKASKSKVGNEMVPLGLNRSFPHPPNSMTLRIALPKGKRRKSPRMIARIIETGPIAFAEIESVVWRLSFNQTSVFGRTGSAMMAPHIYEITL